MLCRNLWINLSMIGNCQLRKHYLLIEIYVVYGNWSIERRPTRWWCLLLVAILDEPHSGSVCNQSEDNMQMCHQYGSCLILQPQLSIHQLLKPGVINLRLSALWLISAWTKMAMNSQMVTTFTLEWKLLNFEGLPFNIGFGCTGVTPVLH